MTPTNPTVEIDKITTDSILVENKTPLKPNIEGDMTAINSTLEGSNIPPNPQVESGTTPANPTRQAKDIVDLTIDNHIKTAHKNAAHVWSLIDKEIKLPDAVLYYNGLPAIFKNTTILLQGKTGSHKSRFASALVSILIADQVEKSLYGFSRPQPEHLSVIYADTERDKNNQLPMMMQQLLKETKLNKEQLVERVILVPLSEVSRDWRLHVLGHEIKAFSKMAKGPMVVVIDVITDFSIDFNSVQSTNAINDIINHANSEFDITFIIVIHENPGGDKARGHLGTELTNKASTIFQISEVKTVKETFQIKMMKSRTTRLYEDNFLKFDAVLNNLLLIRDEELKAKVGNPESYKLGVLLSGKAYGPMEKVDLLKAIEEEFDWKPRKIEEKLKTFVTDKYQFDTPLGLAYLTKTRGKTAVYKVELVSNEAKNSEPNKELDNLEKPEEDSQDDVTSTEDE